MKAIMMSIRPKWVAKILNGEKTIEIRKRFPKDYVGWVYIYCTKDKKYANLINRGGFLTGMVVARFWCDKVEEINKVPLVVIGNYLKNACVSVEELQDYSRNYRYKTYAINITKLEIFDKTKGLWQFKTPKNAKRYEHDLERAYEEDAEISARLYEGIANDDECANCVELTELSEGYYGLQKPPQSWCFVEI